NAELVKLTKEYQDATTPAERKEKLESEIRQRDIQFKASQEDSRRQIAKLTGEHMVQIYKEIEEAVKAFAQANDIEFVLDDTDAAKEESENYYNMNNVTRKMQSGALMPMHWDPRMDISGAIVQMLNSRVAAN